MTHRYFAYGLEVDSEIDLPHWPPGRGGVAEVRITFGGVPPQLAAPQGSGVSWWTAPGEFLFELPGVARFYVRAGGEIRIDPAPGGDRSRLRQQLGALVFGALLHQRQSRLVLHASAVARDDQALVFAATSGSGKSTLLNAMLDRGWRMITDDICPIAIPSGPSPTLVEPGLPLTRLWADAAAALGRSVSGAQRVGELEKYILPTPAIAATPVPLRRIFVLSPHAQDHVSLQDLDVQERFTRLMRLVYRRSFLAGLGLTQVRFQLVSRLAPRIPVTLVERPVHRLAVQEIADRIDACP